jgi:hypothetical protein
MVLLNDLDNNLNGTFRDDCSNTVNPSGVPWSCVNDGCGSTILDDESESESWFKLSFDGSNDLTIPALHYFEYPLPENGTILAWTGEYVFDEPARTPGHVLTITIHTNTFDVLDENESQTAATLEHPLTLPDCCDCNVSISNIQADCVPPDPNIDDVHVDLCSGFSVEFLSDVSNEEDCPETVTRTYEVTSSPCNFSIQINQTISYHCAITFFCIFVLCMYLVCCVFPLFLSIPLYVCARAHVRVRGRGAERLCCCRFRILRK